MAVQIRLGPRFFQTCLTGVNNFCALDSAPQHNKHNTMYLAPGPRQQTPLHIAKAKLHFAHADTDGIRTHAGKAHWISSPTP